MAGNYPDPLSHRMAYDADGTIGFAYAESSGLVQQLSAANLIAMNDEDTSGPDITTIVGSFGRTHVGFIFPELRDLVGYYYQDYSQSPNEILTSTNTTNGLDGTWTQRANPFVVSGAGAPAYRTVQQGLSVTGIIAIKFVANRINSGAFNNVSPRNIHLYGDPNSGATLNRLQFWDPTLNQRMAPNYFDWGNVPRSSSADKTFRIKNSSSTQTAQGVVLTAEALTDTSPSVPGQHLFSSNGTTFSASINIGDLAPGAISSVLYMRRVTPSNAALSVWTLRAKAAATSWV